MPVAALTSEERAFPQGQHQEEVLNGEDRFPVGEGGLLPDYQVNQHDFRGEDSEFPSAEESSVGGLTERDILPTANIPPGDDDIAGSSIAHHQGEQDDFQVIGGSDHRALSPHGPTRLSAQLAREHASGPPHQAQGSAPGPGSGQQPFRSAHPTILPGGAAQNHGRNNTNASRSSPNPTSSARNDRTQSSIQRFAVPTAATQARARPPINCHRPTGQN